LCKTFHKSWAARGFAGVPIYLDLRILQSSMQFCQLRSLPQPETIIVTIHFANCVESSAALKICSRVGTYYLIVENILNNNTHANSILRKINCRSKDGITFTHIDTESRNFP